MHCHVPRHEGLGGKGLEAMGAAVLVWKVHQVSVLEHPGVVDEDKVTLGAVDIKGLLLVDKLHVLLKVGLTTGLVPAYVADELQVVGCLMAK